MFAFPSFTSTSYRWLYTQGLRAELKGPIERCRPRKSECVADRLMVQSSSKLC